MEKSGPKTTKEHISLIFDSIIDIIKYPKTPLDNNAYFYHTLYRNEFIIYIYIFKLLINDNDYLKQKYLIYKNKYHDKKSITFSKITNLEVKDELELLYLIKEKTLSGSYKIDTENHTITYKDLSYIDSNWLITFISLLLDNSSSDCDKEINICYTIPNKDIFKLKKPSDIEAFLSEFTFYSIKVRHVDLSRPVKENNILIVKNAAINYLKHLKQYKHGLETEESYRIFYNLLRNECRKDGFELEEKELSLVSVDEKLLNKVYSYIDDTFYTYQLSKQVHIIENCIWQSSNDITLLEHTNSSIDYSIDFLSVLRLNKELTYEELKQKYDVNDIQILLILVTSKFLLTYYNSNQEVDYSLINLTSIKPKYMNSICPDEEQELKTLIKSYEVELNTAKKEMDKYKADRQALDSEELPPDKYQKELERCVGNINTTSIVIGRINSNLSSLIREYESIRKEKESKYNNVDLYNYNYSIIKHICNSIIGCSYYLKTNNLSSIFNNIIIFEDFEKTDNSFYLEVSFRELLKISKQSFINGILNQSNLPKLAKKE
jgi:hypothetical protein